MSKKTCPILKCSHSTENVCPTEQKTPTWSLVRLYHLSAIVLRLETCWGLIEDSGSTIFNSPHPGPPPGRCMESQLKPKKLQARTTHLPWAVIHT